jgi:DNA repair exonuclease SbcCD nuclease subunit
MNLMFFGDIHCEEKSIPEIESIFSEILTIKDTQEVDGVIITGDSFDNVKPSPDELDCLASFLKKLNCPIQIIVAKSHESISETESVINHFGLLNNKISVCTEYQDEKYLYVGHFTLAESKYNYGSTISKKQFAQYKHVILGHQHSFQEIKPNIIHIGSIRYIDFAEAQDKEKFCLIIKNYRTIGQTLAFIPLKSLIPMISLELGKNEQNNRNSETQNETQITKSSKFEGEDASNLRQNKALSDLLGKLDGLPAKMKVRIVFKDCHNYSCFLPFVSKYKNKFVVFKMKNDFVINLETVSAKKENTSLKESLIKFLEINKTPEEIKKILLEVIK